MSPIYDPRFSQTKREEALQLEQDASKQASRIEYIKPLVILGIAFPLAMMMIVGSRVPSQDFTTASITQN